MIAPAPDAIRRGRDVLDKLNTGLRARAAGLITIGELDSIIEECNDSTRARSALNRGVASCL